MQTVPSRPGPAFFSSLFYLLAYCCRLLLLVTACSSSIAGACSFVGSVRPPEHRPTNTNEMSITSTKRSAEGTANSGEALDSSSPVRIAYAGNSMLYFYDTPRFFSNLAGERRVASQDSCFRGGASLPSLLEDGNGMANKFRVKCNAENDVGSPTVESMLSSQNWDFLVMNDYTQAPSRIDLRKKTISTLLRDYSPMIVKCQAIPVFIITPAYRKAVKDSADLGSPEEFTERTRQGCEEYASALNTVLQPAKKCRIAPVGLAYLHIRKNKPSLWERLFHIDDFHPSPHGAYLQGCVLHWTLFRCAPDCKRLSPRELWCNARRMQPPNDDELPVPTLNEAEYLCDVAGAVCRDYNDICL